MINEQTIISSFDDKGTLLKWLKAVENALEKASATEFLISKKGNSTISFILKFADDTQLESGDITLEQGESVESASIVNGHLLLTLTNGEVLDAGELFNGNVNLNGSFTANSIIEKMEGYTAVVTSATNYLKENTYLSVVKTGNKITFVISMDVTKQEGAGSTLSLAYFNIPSSVGAKLYPSGVGSANMLDNRKLNCFSGLQSAVEVNGYASKGSNAQITFACIGSPMVVGTTYHIRYEATFLLSDNLAQ